MWFRDPKSLSLKLLNTVCWSVINSIVHHVTWLTLCLLCCLQLTVLNIGLTWSFNWYNSVDSAEFWHWQGTISAGCIESVDGDFGFRIRTVIRLSDNSESFCRTTEAVHCWTMHAFIEEPNTSHCDCMVQSLSWMGRTPDSQPENGAWRLNEANYYHQGWLASGNTRGVIGITFTACLAKSVDPPPRTNFYLRGHRSEVKRLTRRFIFEFYIVKASRLVNL